MKWIAVLGLTAASAASAAEPALLFLDEAEEVRLALDAGPEHLRDGAAVYAFGKTGYRKVRGGSNGFTCLVNRDGNQNADNDVKPTCWDAEGTRTIVPVMLRVGELLSRAASADEIRRDIDAGFASGKFTKPAKAGIAYMLIGDLGFDPKTQKVTRTLFPAHYMIYAPGVSAGDIGVSGRPKDSRVVLPSVYSGYSGAPNTTYLIVPAAPGDAHRH
ncbi:MAG: hypothetical protein ABW136_11655 [Steroidobacteraceae bacterium]